MLKITRPPLLLPVAPHPPVHLGPSAPTTDVTSGRGGAGHGEKCALSHAIDAIQAVVAGDAGWELAGPVLIVAAFAVAFLILAPVTLRRRTA